MTHSRETSDPWAHRAHAILDRAQTGNGLAHHIEWALAYLGDKASSTKIPRDLMGSGRRSHIPGALPKKFTRTKEAQ